MIDREILLVAEQDGDGRVAAVWKRANGDRTARPMRTNDLDQASLARADFHGSSPQDILAFIDRLPKIDDTLPYFAARL